MSDVPFDGWWRANDGRWYPPETSPSDGLGPQSPPPGWWQSEDGGWYPPHLHPRLWPSMQVIEPLPAQRRHRRPMLVGFVLGVGLAVGVGLTYAAVSGEGSGRPAGEVAPVVEGEMLPPVTAHAPPEQPAGAGGESPGPTTTVP